MLFCDRFKFFCTTASIDEAYEFIRLRMIKIAFQKRSTRHSAPIQVFGRVKGVLGIPDYGVFVFGIHNRVFPVSFIKILSFEYKHAPFYLNKLIFI